MQFLNLSLIQSGSRLNDENAEREFSKETTKSQAVAARLQEVEAGMMKQIFPSSEDKLDLQ